MFTGIIETVGVIRNLFRKGENLTLEIESVLAQELKVDQSVSHNGVCLTVIETKKNTYLVTDIKETLEKTNLKTLKKASSVNLARAIKFGDSFDAHTVQGH